MNDVSGPITVLRVIVQFINTEELILLTTKEGTTLTIVIYLSTL